MTQSASAEIMPTRTFCLSERVCPRFEISKIEVEILKKTYKIQQKIEKIEYSFAIKSFSSKSIFENKQKTTTPIIIGTSTKFILPSPESPFLVITMDAKITTAKKIHFISTEVKLLSNPANIAEEMMMAITKLKIQNTLLFSNFWTNLSPC